MSTSTIAAPTNGAMFRTIQFGEFVDLELREDSSGMLREFEGIAVPWEVETDLDGWASEVWTRGAFNHQLRAANRVSVGNGHIPLGGDLIGALREMRDDAKGLYTRGRITPGVVKGDEAIALMSDKALRELSIGFFRVPGGDVRTTKKDGGVLYRMNKANLFEVALVPWGQYGRNAQVSSLRQAAGSSFEPIGGPARESIAVRGHRVLTLSVDGVELASVPWGGQLPELPAPGPSAPAEPVVDVPEGIALADAALDALPELNLGAED